MAGTRRPRARRQHARTTEDTVKLELSRLTAKTLTAVVVAIRAAHLQTVDEVETLLIGLIADQFKERYHD